MKCWICGQIADSKEHRIKKSDLIRAFGRGPYHDNLLHVRFEQPKTIQGPNSNRLKYDKSLCQYCNSTLTQPFDRAYDTFIDYIYENESEILEDRIVDFYQVYGDDFGKQQTNLYKYFVKSFGCRLHDAQRKIPDDLKVLLNQDTFQTGLRISFAVNKDIAMMPNKFRDSFIGKGELLGLGENRDKGYIWREHISWLFINYWYMAQPEGQLGVEWTADNRFIYLGYFYSDISDEDRKKFYDRLD